MSKNIRLYVNGESVDYFEAEDFNITLKFAADDLSDPTRRRFPKSYSFELPKTLKNNQLFNNINSRFVINKFNTNKLPATLSVNTVTVLTGFIIIKEIKEDSYVCELQSSYLEFADAVEKKKLKNLQSFTKIGFDYEDSIVAHVNAGYTNDSLTNLIPSLTDFSNTGGSGAFWTGTSTRTITTTNGDRSLIGRWAARANTTYTLSITFSGTVGTFALLEFALGNGYVGAGLGEISRNVKINFKPTASPQTVEFKITPTVNTEMIIIRPIQYNSGNIFNVSEVKLIDPIDTCDWQYPFIMYERFYTPKEIIDLTIAQDEFFIYSSQGSTDNIINQNATKRNLLITALKNVNTQIPLYNNFNYWQFPPAPYLTKILKYIVQEAGFELAGSWIQNAEINKLIIPYTGDPGVWQNGNGIISTFDELLAADDEVYVDKTTTLTIAAFGNQDTDVWTKINFNNEISDINANYSNVNFEYTFPKAYRAKIQSVLNVFGNKGSSIASVSNNLFCTIQVVQDRGGVLTILDETKFGRTSDNYELNIETSSFDFEIGDKVYMRARVWSSVSGANTITAGGIPQPGEGQLRINGGGTFNSDFAVRMGGGSETVTFLNVAAFLPDMEQLEFLKEIVTLFNLQMFIVDKTIYLEDYNSAVLPNAYAIDLTGKAVDETFTEIRIDQAVNSLQFKLDDNEDDNVPFVPNNLRFPQDLSKITRIRKKELNVNGKIYKGNDIFNKQTGNKVVTSKFAPTNFRKIAIAQNLNFSDTSLMPSSFTYRYLTIPVISSMDDLHKEWYTNTGDNVDDKKYADMSYGNGLRILKYEGNSAQSTSPFKERWWIYMGNNARMRLGLTSFLNLNAKITDVNGYSYFDHKNEIGFSYPLEYTPYDVNNKTVDFNFNNDGAITYLSGIKNAYDKYYAKKYQDIEKSNYLVKNFYLTELEWNLLNKNRSVSFEGQTYSVEQIDYQMIDGVARIKMLKRIS